MICTIVDLLGEVAECGPCVARGHKDRVLRNSQAYCVGGG